MLKRYNEAGMAPHADEQCHRRAIHWERVAEARKEALPRRDNERLAALFKAMGDPGRLRILFALQSGEMCVCDLAALLGLTESAVSHQLRLLRQLGLVANRREGPVLYYRLKDRHVLRLVEQALDHVREPAVLSGGKD